MTRAAVLALAGRRGWAAMEVTLPLAVVGQAQEVFLTNSLMEVLPVVRIDGVPVGAGSPGPITQALAAAFAALPRQAQDGDGD